MSVFRPSELKELLESLGVSPKKGLSQNFLIDGNILKKIVALAQVNPGDSILEIGPGPGALTESLLNAQAKVTAVEKDTVWANSLSRFNNPDLSVYNEDILEFSLDAHLKPGTKVVANLPYHITTPIITKLVTKRDLIDSITVMVQDEVARRMVGKPKTADYSSLSLFLSYYCDAVYGFKVKRGSFYPPPNVDSAVVFLKLKKPPHVSNEERFFKMVRQAFNQRRKMMRASLSEIYPKDVIEKNLPNPKSRPEELGLSEFILFFEAIEKETQYGK